MMPAEAPPTDEALTLSAVPAQIVGSQRRSLMPPPRRRISEWADENFYLSPESAAEPGRWKTLPYQVGILDAFSDPFIESVAVIKSARVGWTKCINVLSAYHMVYDPCPMMIVLPTIEDAEGHSKEEVAPMLRDCPVLARIMPDARAKDSGNTILHKMFPGGSLSIVGANSPRGFRRVSRRIVLFDETDGYPASAGAEGDQIKLGIRRTEYYWNRKIGYGSTPTIAGLSRIERLFEAGDQRRYYVPCPHCSTMQVLKFPNFRWPKNKPQLAVYLCEDCGAEIEHVHKRDMVHAGEWRATQPFTGHASFHIWAAYSFSPNAGWGQLCTEFVEAKAAGPEHLKTFVNTVLGETWQDRGEAPDWERLYQRRETYAKGSCPKGVLFLTAGVDVQKDRLMFEVVGWGRGKSSWSIDSGVLPGDTSDQAVWAQLDALLARTFVTEADVPITIAMLAVDSGYNTQVVYNWARRHPMSRVIAVKGMPAGASVLIGSPSPVDVSVSGRKLQHGYKVWPVAGNVAKGELYGWLKLQPPTDEAVAEGITFAPGFCHFPEYGEDYFKQLTAEQLIPHKKRNGFTLLAWEQIPGRDNHYLDCRVYARAAAAIVGLDRFSESDWMRLEAALGYDPPSPTSPGQSPTGPTAEPRGQREPWIPRRGGGWIKRGR